MKRKLFLLLCALLTMIGVQAQRPVPTFSDMVADGTTEQYLYNVEADAFLTGGNDWGTRASLERGKGNPVKLTNNGNGTYILADKLNYGAGDWQAVFTDNSISSSWVDNAGRNESKTWTIAVADADKKLYYLSNTAVTVISDPVYAASPYLNDSRLYFAEKNNAVLSANTWAFVSSSDYESYQTALASWDASTLKSSTVVGTDITEAFGNICTEPDDNTGWTINNSSTFHRNHWSWEGLEDGSWITPYFLENWVGAGELLPEGKWSYTLEGLVANQYYNVSAYIRAYNEGTQDAPAGAYLYAGSANGADISTGTVSSYGDKPLVYGRYNVLGQADENGNLVVGLMEKNNNFNWVVMRDFKIEVGEFNPEIDVINTDEVFANADAKSSYNEALSTFNANKTYANYLLFLEAENALKASIIIYGNIQSSINTYAAKAASLDAAGQAAYDASGVTTKYNNGTYETLAEAETELQTALVVAIKAQTTNGADMTPVITNPSFETGDLAGWTNPGDAPFSVSNGSDLSNKNGNWYATVSNNRTRSLTQTVSLHEGKYILSVNARLAKQGDNAGTATIGFGGNTTNIPNGRVADTYTVAYETAEDANVAINYNKTPTYTNHYFDNFTLTYYTELPDVDITELAAKPMKASVLSALNNASTTYAGSKTVANYNSLQNAIVEAKISAEIYSAYATYEAKAVANLTAAGLESFNSNVTVAEYYDGTYAGTETQESEIKTAYVAALKAYPVVGADFTDAITNPSFETGDLTEWTSSTMGAQGNKAFDRTDGNYYVESWHPGTAGEKSVIATVAELPAGFYKLTVAAYANDVNSAKIFAKNGDTEYNTSVSTSRDYTVGLYYDGTSTFTIGYSADMNAGAGWVCVDNFRLNYYGANDATCLIKDADCSSNDFWAGGGRTFDTKTDWTGTSRQVFSNNGTGYNRSQGVTFPLAGKYRLDVYGLVENETGFFEAKVGTTGKSQNYNQSLNHYIVASDGTESNTVKTSGTGWTIQEIYFDIANAGDEATIALRPSCGNGGGHTEYGYIGGLKLTYLGASGTLVDMQVSATAKVGTFCAPYDVKVPARVTAHTVSQGSGDWIRLSDPLEDGIIPAGTPVILQAEDGIAVAIQKTYFGTDNTAASDSYVLKGLYEAEEKTSGANPYYILQYVAGDGGAGFYRVPTGETRNLAANRCYLLPDNVNSGARIAIGGEDDPTAINEVEIIESEAKTMKDGKYLVKGRIVLVKNGKAFSTNGQKLN